MAALTSSNVRIVKEWVEGTLTGKRRHVKRVEVHGGSWGGDTPNSIPASAFGLRVVEETSVAYNVATNAAVVVSPNQDGTLVKLFVAANNSTTPADVTASATPSGLYFVVKGY